MVYCMCVCKFDLGFVCGGEKGKVVEFVFDPQLESECIGGSLVSERLPHFESAEGGSLVPQRQKQASEVCASISARLVQRRKAPLPMWLTLAGMLMSVRL